jgi:hypothetical protein
MNSKKPLRGLLARAPLATAVTMALMSASTAQAFEFERGGLTGSLDTTISYGISIRAQEQDEELIGKAAFNPLLCRYNQGVPPLPTAPPQPPPFPTGPGSPFFYLPVITPCTGTFRYPGPPVPPPPAGTPNPSAPYFPGSPTQIAAPGRFSVNRDDGNTKYDEGEPISNAIKITSELGLKWGQWGLFTRATNCNDY